MSGKSYWEESSCANLRPKSRIRNWLEISFFLHLFSLVFLSLIRHLEIRIDLAIILMSKKLPLEIQVCMVNKNPNIFLKLDYVGKT